MVCVCLYDIIGNSQLGAIYLCWLYHRLYFYDMTHYVTHHTPMKKGYFRTFRQHHMHHHFQTPNQLFGVTGPMWYIVYKNIA